MLERNSYVYRHTKLGTKDVFYIGIGKQPKYKRAYDKRYRNKLWINLVNKYGYEVEILSHNLSWEEACFLETLLISYYGRKDLNKGYLVNLTDGGEGGLGCIKTKEQIEKWKKSNKGKQNGKRNVMFCKTRGKHPLAKDVLNLETGIFYDCALSACETTNMPYSTLKGKLNRSSNNNTSFIYADDYENGLMPYKSTKKYAKKVIDTQTMKVYDSILIASKCLKINTQTLYYRLNKNTSHLRYL